MRAGAALALAAFAASVAATAAASVSYDAAKHSVTFTAASTDCGLDMQLEFLFVGPDSDHDYEAMFVTESSVAEIAEAFKKAGIPMGRPFDGQHCRLWPVGERLTIEPALTNLVREMRGGTFPTIAFTGGTRDAAGIPEAHTNSPGAVFALYNCAQSLIQFNDSLGQSESYGRFQPAVKIPKGEVRRFTFTWDGQPSCASLTLPLASGKLVEALTTLKEKAATTELDVLCDFSPEMTLKEANEAAQALAMIDSVRVKINGVKDGQFFYRAFLPMESWRDRKERLAQPPEVHLNADGTFKVIEVVEDWSDPDSLDPKLSIKETACPDAASAAKLASTLGAKTFTIFLYATPSTKLERLSDFRRHVTGDILNWYIFAE